MIFNEFDDTPAPPEVEPIPVPMCPTFYGCVTVVIIVGLAAVCLVMVLWWALSAAVVR